MSSRRAILTVTLFCLAAVLAGPATVNAADVLSKVPADALFCVRVNNLEAAAGALDQFLVGVAPVPPLAPMIKMQLGKGLGDPNLAAIDTTGAFALYGMVKDKDSDPEIYVLMPIKDKKALLAAKGVETDANGISALGGGADAIMVPVGDYAIICPEEQYAGLAAMAKATAGKTVAETLAPAEKAGAATAPLWARLDMVKINALYGDEMAGQFEKIRKSPGMMAQGTPGASAALDAYFKALMSLMKQTQTLNVMLTPKADALALSTMLVAKPGTEMASTLALGWTPKGSPDTTAYLQDGALANYYMRMNKAMLEKVYLSFFDLFAGSEGGLSPRDTEKVKGLITKAFAAMGDTAVGSIKAAPGKTPPFGLDYVVQVKDAKAMDEVVKDVRDMMNDGPLGRIYKSMGINVSMAYGAVKVPYNGFDIDSTTIAMKAKDPNSQEARTIAAMYGEGLKGCKAMGKGVMLYSVSADPDATIRQLIDSFNAGGPKTGNGEFKAAMTLVPDAGKADFIATYNYLRIFKSFSGLIPIPGIGEALAKLPESKSNLVIAGRAGDGAFGMDIVLPKQHAQEIMAAVQQVQVQMMQQRKNSQPKSNGKSKGSMPD